MWEYKFVAAPCSSTQHVIVWLNEQGKLGWEMICKGGYSRRRKSIPAFYFKREIIAGMREIPKIW